MRNSVRFAHSITAFHPLATRNSQLATSMTQFHSTVLSNGLTVLAETIPYAYSVSVCFFVNTGSRDETDVESGVSHFLEHMIFRGSQKRKGEDVSRAFDDMGASNNACTGEDSTMFYASFLPEFLEPVIELWSDVLRPALRESDFNSERQVILEELKMYQDEPPYDMDEQARRAYFNGHPLGNPIIGTVDSLNAMTPEIMRNYLNRQYVPNNIVLCAAGKVDFDLLTRLAEKYLGAWTPRDVKRNLQSFTPGQRFNRVVDPTAAQEYIIDWYPGPNPIGRDYYVAKMFSSLIGESAGSRFYWKLSDVGLADSAQLSYSDYTETGAFNASFSCAPEDEKTCMDIVADVYEDVLKNGFSEKELDQRRRRELASLIMREERILTRVFSIASDWVCRNQYFTIDDEINILKSVTLDEINDMAKRFPLNPSVRFVVGPNEGNE